MLIPDYYEDLSVLHQNTMPVHSYFIPVSRQAGIRPGPSQNIGSGLKQKDCTAANMESYRMPNDCAAADAELSLKQNDYTASLRLREDSDRVQMLSGCKWLFRYFPDIHELREEFYREDYRPDSAWKQEIVPFCWQMRGYDEHQYTNIRYPFPFDPPYVPRINPCGAYIHTFTWHPDPDAPRTYLHFEGIDSCFYVWVNGIFSGYSQVTHHTSEFDVTSLLRDGKNVLALLVLKWCDGSYLEDQDKFRMSGIIRDVYLVKRPEHHITDYVITTNLSDDLHTADLNIRFLFREKAVPVRLTLFREAALPEEGNDCSPRVYEFHTDSSGEAHLRLRDPLLWNAETPHLYTLLMETEHEIIPERVGFREVCVRNGVLLLNGSPIKFRGVNRHESDSVTGAAVYQSQVLEDLNRIKANNFNSVRASHYPNVPYFYQLCDEIGLYVIDEADNESHGTAPLYFTEDDYAERMKLAHERIADNPAFTAPTLDRVSSMVLRNRNRPSILIWSMGNECGYGCTFEEALHWTKKTDPTRLTHYESAYYLPDDREYDVSDIDVYGRMYPAFEEVRDYLRNDPGKPLLLVEYCHSMGNSPGDLKEYRDMIEEYPRLCGGFVWEWCDHAIYKGLAASNGKAMYWYGGDHGELQHDGNFCLDGLVYPDRRPHTGLLEYKNVHRPFRASYDAETGMLSVRNLWDFLSSACVEARFRLTLDGETVQTGTVPLPEIPAQACISVPLALRVPEKGRCFLTVVYTLKQAVAGMPEGHELGFDDIPVRNTDGRNRRAASSLQAADAPAPSVTESGTDICIAGWNFSYRLDMLSGRFTSLIAGGKEFLKAPMDFNLWRAPTDNDQPLADLWKWQRLDHTVTRAYETSWEREDNSVLIRIRQSVAAMSVQPILRICSEYRLHPDGTICMGFHAEKDAQIATLPRIGLRLFLDPALDAVEYFGIGPYESYIDKCRAGRHGLFRSTVSELHEDYIRPQENGSRCDCDYVRLTGGGLTLTAASADEHTFSFNASVYTQEELEAKRHNYELEPCGDTVLCLDHRMAGIGSKSCGPDLSEEYRVDAEEYRFAFRIRPEYQGKELRT